MRYLITGGCGFLGSNLAHEVLTKQHGELTVFDNMSRFGATQNLDWLRATGDFRFVHGDVRMAADVDAVIAAAKPDVVFHLAGQVAMTTSLASPRKDFETNALGTLNVLEALRAHNSKAALLYSSTNKVYGDLEWVRYEETATRHVAPDYPRGFKEDVPLDFRSPYGTSKGAADQYILDYHRSFGLRTAVFRHSSMYGSRQFSTYDQGWIGWFCQCAQKQKKGDKTPFTISGDGKQVRDLLHVDDMVALYLRAAEQIDRIDGRPFNVGGGMDNSLSLLELFAVLERHLDVKLSYERLPARASDQKVFVADTAALKDSIGWVPRVNKEEGLARMLEWDGAGPMIAELVAEPPNETLAFCIPTYNRKDQLRACITSLVPQIAKHRIPIYVSDNDSSYDFDALITELRAAYPYIYAKRNPKNLGMGANFLKVVAMAETEFAWIFSDDDQLAPGAVDAILSLCASGKYDLVVPNREYRKPDLSYDYGKLADDTKEPLVFTNPADLIVHATVKHFSYVGCLVFRVSRWRKVESERYLQYLYFPHVSVVAEMMLPDGVGIVLPEPWIQVRGGTFSWEKRAGMVWYFYLQQCLEVVPGYSNAVKRRALWRVWKENSVYPLWLMVRHGTRWKNVSEFARWETLAVHARLGAFGMLALDGAAMASTLVMPRFALQKALDVYREHKAGGQASA